MIDLHSHILPGIDDGPSCLAESVEICAAAEADGVRTLVATPHYKPGTYEWSGQEVSETVSALQSALRAEGLLMDILPGAELSIFPELPSLVKEGSAFTINRGIYFLVEFRPHAVPANWETFLGGFIDSGLVPVIAHPERNGWFMGRPDVLSSIVGRGALVQVTAASITGGLGPQARDFSAYLLKRNLVHVIASDAHSPDERPALLSEAVGIAGDLIGPERARAMVTSIPGAIISGKRLPAADPAEYACIDQAGRGGWLRRLLS